MLLGLTISIISIIVIPYFVISNISKIKKYPLKIRKKSQSIYRVSKEIFHNYKTGAVTFRTLVDFGLFKIRLWVIHHLETGLLKSSKEKYELVYYHGSGRYKIKFPKNRGVRQISQVETRLGQNVTSEILELMGPGCNFHGIPSTPKLLGWDDGLYVKYRSGEEVFYESTDAIKLHYS